MKRLLCKHLRELIKKINHDFEVDISDPYGFTITCKKCNIEAIIEINPALWYKFGTVNKEHDNKLYKRISRAKNPIPGMRRVMVPITPNNPYKRDGAWL